MSSRRIRCTAALAGIAVVAIARLVAAGPLTGSVLDGATLDPVAGARIVVDGAELTATTDSLGRYHFDDVPPGTITVRVIADGYADTEEIVALGPDGMADLVIAVFREGSAGETIVVIDRAPLVAEAPGETELSREEITKLPGTRGDALTSIKSLPGVANADAAGSGTGLIVIRGAAPEDSLYLLDGVQIPIVYHFFGLQSVLPSEFIEDIEFLPGGFGVVVYWTQRRGWRYTRIAACRAGRQEADPKVWSHWHQRRYCAVTGRLVGPLA